MREAQELLEFHKIRQQLAAHAGFFASREMALTLEPSYNSEEVSALQEQTREASHLLERNGDMDLSVPQDPRPILQRASLSGMLTGGDLLEVSQTLEAVRRAKSFVSRTSTVAPGLACMARQIPSFGELSRQIRASVGHNGEVLDAATPTLGDLRRLVRDAYHRLVEALNGIIQSPLGTEVLQDQVVSTRGERLVLQVKAEMRHRLPGIVHDVSHTGATLFIEPFSTVELCNVWREATLAEQREVEQVLRHLTESVGIAADGINLAIDLTARLDLILAKGRYGRALGAASPRQPKEGDGCLGLVNARHPLLGPEAVPVSIRIGPGWWVLVITGPNTGGKTVAMKTVGLLALMRQAGLLIPADDTSFMSTFEGVYADIGDQQSIEQSVSTFSSHMRNVIEILSAAGPGSLALLDELGTSTDPEEGSALAKAILTDLAQRCIATVATTHHRSVAAFAEESAAMINASVELAPVTLKPTYHLTIGVPGRSYAMSVAASLGLPEEVLRQAQSLMGPQHLQAEQLLEELQRERQQLLEKERETERAAKEAERLRQELSERLRELSATKEEMREATRQELLLQARDMKEKLNQVEAALQWSPQPPSMREVRSSVTEVERELRGPDWRAPRRETREEEAPLSPGDRVEVAGFHLQGEVLSPADEEGQVEVMLGNLRLRLEARRLTKVGAPLARRRAQVEIRRASPSYETPKSELDLRGQRAEEALTEVDAFLDRATLDGLSSVRIIHGHGTGALRQAIRDHLSRHPLAQAYAPEERDRGGDGVTVVELGST